MRLLLLIFTTSVFVTLLVLKLEKDTYTQKKYKHITHIEQKLSIDSFPTDSYHHVFMHFNMALKVEKQEKKKVYIRKKMKRHFEAKII